MDWQRNALIAAILLVLALLFVRWNEFQARQITPVEAAAEDIVVAPEVAATPVASDIPERIPGEAAPVEDQAPAAERLVTVRTDVLAVTIDTYGGDIVRAALLEHRESLKPDADPYVLLNSTSSRTYVAQSGLIGPNGTDSNEGRPRFTVSGSHFELSPGEDSIQVDLQLRQGEVLITKRFDFRRGDYLIDVDYKVENGSDTPWSAGMFGQIKRDDRVPPVDNKMGMRPFVGAAITTNDENYKKFDFEDLGEKSFNAEKTGGWVSMIQHYFISAWIPNQETTNSFTLRKLGSGDIYTFGFTSPAVTVPAGESGNLGASFYVGPKDQQRLEQIAPYLDLTIDYGWLWWVAKPIFYVMTFIHGLVGNWGWSIILLTVLIKLVFFKLSAASYRSMAKMRKLQPEMARLKDLYGDDRQKMSQAMMEFYKKEKVNPLGGCLPILVQMPVFIALYWVLFESVELRHAPWILWINDLSVKDPYFVLPVLNGISMFVTTLLQPEPPDPTQAKIMKIMPIAFAFMFAFFPAGLVLYWTVNSVLSILQQWVVTRRIEAGKG